MLPHGEGDSNNGSTVAMKPLILLDVFYDIASFLLDFAGYLFSGTAAFHIPIVRGASNFFLYGALEFTAASFDLVCSASFHNFVVR